MKKILLLIVSLCAFYYVSSTCYKLNSIRLIINNSPVVLAKKSIPIYDEDKVYFDKEKFSEYFDEYYKDIEQYCLNYSVIYRFYDAATGGLVSRNFNGVQIKIYAKVNYFQQISDEFKFEISKGEYH